MVGFTCVWGICLYIEGLLMVAGDLYADCTWELWLQIEHGSCGCRRGQWEDMGMGARKEKDRHQEREGRDSIPIRRDTD